MAFRGIVFPLLTLTATVEFGRCLTIVHISAYCRPDLKVVPHLGRNGPQVEAAELRVWEAQDVVARDQVVEAREARLVHRPETDDQDANAAVVIRRLVELHLRQVNVVMYACTSPQVTDRSGPSQKICSIYMYVLRRNRAFIYWLGLATHTTMLSMIFGCSLPVRPHSLGVHHRRARVDLLFLTSTARIRAACVAIV